MRILKSNFLLNLLSSILTIYIKFVYKTSCWETIGKQIPESYINYNKPFIICFWHNRIMMASFGWVWKIPLYALTSSHEDGQLIANVLNKIGILTISGSTNKNGSVALLKMIKLLKNNKYICITPDGPKGPKQKVSLGVVALSNITNADIIPFVCSVKRKRVFNSWDEFIFAFPFNKGTFIWGEPITSAEITKLDQKSACELIEKKINALTNKADEQCLLI